MCSNCSDLSCVRNSSITQEESKARVTCEFAPNCDPKKCTVILQCDSSPQMPGQIYYLNNQENSTLVDEIVLKCGSLYYPLCANITLNVFGSINGQIDEASPVVSAHLNNCRIAASKHYNYKVNKANFILHQPMF